MTPIRRLLTLGALVTLSSVTFARQPNILFISIDDLRPQLGAYGLGYMHTPNLDQLATEGRLFTRHYVQVPTCGPSRACLLTGKNLRSDTEISHPYLGESLAGRPVGEFPETFIEHLKRNGYRTIGMGKISHSGNGRIKGGVPELPHSWDNFVDDPVGGNLVHAFAHGKDRTKDKMPPYECLDLPDEAYPDGRLAQLAISQLDEFARADQPFFMAVGFYKPHLPFCAPK